MGLSNICQAEFHICLPYRYEAKVHVITFLHLLWYMPYVGLAPCKESIRHEVSILHHSYKTFNLTTKHEFRHFFWHFFLSQDSKEIELTTVQRIFSEYFCFFSTSYLSKAYLLIEKPGEYSLITLVLSTKTVLICERIPWKLISIWGRTKEKTDNRLQFPGCS